jgi:hypothetical protein
LIAHLAQRARNLHCSMAAIPREALRDGDVGRLGTRSFLYKRVLGNAGERHPTTTSGSGEGSSPDDP